MNHLYFAGIVCIIGGFGALGMIQAQGKRRRLLYLKELEWKLRRLREKIVQLHMPLALALDMERDGEQDEMARLFTAWGKELLRNRGSCALDAWRTVSSKKSWVRILTVEDRQFLEKFASQVGQGSEEEEKRLFTFLLEELRNQQEQAQMTMQSQCQLFQYGGFITGMVVVLLLL